MFDIMKKLLPAYIVSFVFSFMLCFNEPITMYMLNFNDFWFDLPLIFTPILLAFIGVFLILAFLFTGIYYIGKKKNNNIYNISLVVFFVIFICTYIRSKICKLRIVVFAKNSKR